MKSDAVTDIKATPSDRGGAGGSLAGVRVVDLSRVLAGPYCTMILADHGADVIKIEPPAGDETRKWGPPFDDVAGGSSYFVGINRNKRSVTLNLKDDADRSRLIRLLDGADVVIENFKPGTMESWGLGYDAISKSRPELIYCRISGFGSTGPMGGMAGYDAVIQAMSGLMSVNGTPESGATKIGTPIVDLSTGLYSAIAILMALNERHRSGMGQFIDMTLHDCALAMLHPHAPNYLMNGVTPIPLGNTHPNLAPCDKYETKSGDIFIAIGNDGQFRKLTDVLGRSELATDDRFATNSNRVKHKHELFEELQAVFRELDGQQICDELLRQSVPAGPVLSVGASLAEQQTAAREMIVEGPDYRGIASPIKFSRTKAGLRYGPPSQSKDQHILEGPDSPWETGE